MKILHRLTSDIQRPDVPPTHEVYYAPRPIYGTSTWHGAYGFIAIIDPTDTYADLWRKRNEELDARLVIYHTDDEAEAYVKALCEREGYNYAEYCQYYDKDARLNYFLDDINGRHSGGNA